MSDFSDILGGLGRLGETPEQKLAETTRRLAEQRRQREQAALDATPVPPMRGKTVDGVKYLRAEDVLVALDSTRSAIRVAAKIRNWTRP